MLITGCAGFIGSHLSDRFVDHGWRVIGLDNLMSGSRGNLARAEASGRFEFHHGDIIDPFEVSADLLVNLACTASPPRYQADPLHTLRTSVIGTLNMAELGHRLGARVVHSSTSEVYGDPEVHPQRESYRGSVNPIGPRACYDEGKRAAETVLFDYHRRHGLDIGVCRIFNTYGPRMDPFDGRVVSNFLRQALLGEPLTIYGKGQQSRSFCYVDDLIEGIWRLCHAKRGVTGPINLGNTVEMTVLELAETVRELVGRRVELVFAPLPMDDPAQRRPDIALAKSSLRWEPTVSLKDGLSRTLDYFDNLISSGRIEDYALADRLRYQKAAG